MKKVILFILSIFPVVALFMACSNMNDIHDIYLAEGERIYIGKVDSIKLFPGNERVKIRYWASDPRAKTVGFYWYPNNDSMFVDITHVTNKDSFEVYVGGIESAKTIAEGNYTLRIITRDNKGHFSIPFEKIMNVYGSKFQSTLTNRILKSLTYNDTDGLLSLNLSGAVNDKEIGARFYYTDREGVSHDDFIADAKITGAVQLVNVDPTKGVKYQTAFLPDPMAIDTFYTTKTPITIEQTVNVAKGKTVVTSDNLNASYTGVNAVDGVIADASRWVSTATGTHWIEIDLGQEYAVNAFETWNGSSGQVNTPLPAFSFEVQVNGEWVSLVSITGNTNANYKASFPEIKTSKVRFTSQSQTRLFEIAVYTTFRY